MIKAINDQKSGVVFLLWGQRAIDTARTVKAEKYYLFNNGLDIVNYKESIPLLWQVLSLLNANIFLKLMII